MSAAKAHSASAIPLGKWSVDAERSTVAFSMKHMLLATVNGRFREFDGLLDIGTDAPRAFGTVKAGSIDTEERVRDEHLRSSLDFFDVERYPEISFSSTGIDYRSAGRLNIVGELTMRGITRQIELAGRLGETPREAGGDRVELELHGELNRRDFGLVWNQALDAGGALLANKVKIALEISAVKTDSP